MGKNQVSVSTVGEMAQVLELAKSVFPDAETEAELYRRVATGWLNDRREGGKGKKLDGVQAKLDLISNDILAIRVAVGQIEALLSALLVTVGEEHDLGKALENRVKSLE